MPAREAWGLDIGQTGLRAAKVRRLSSGRVELCDVFFSALATNLEDPAFEEKVAAALQAFVAEKRVGNTPMAVALPGFTTLFREFPLPAMGGAKLDEIVSYEAKQLIPYPLEEVVWDYQKLREDPESSEVTVALLCCRRDIVEGVLGILDEARCNVEVLQVAPIALANYVLFETPPSGVAVLLDTGARGTDFIVLNQGAFWLRAIPLSGTDLSKALMAKFNIPYERAEELKMEMGESKQADRVFRVVEPVLRGLCAEIQRSIGFYKSLYRGAQVSELICAGNTFLLAGVDQFVADNVGMSTRTMNVPSASLAVGRAVDTAELEANRQVLGIAAGLALQGLGKAHFACNLLPRERRLRRLLAAKLKWAAAAVASLALAMAVSLFASGGTAYRFEPMIKEAEEIRRLEQANRDEYASYEQKVPAEEAKIRALADFGRTRGYLLEALGEALRPVEVWNGDASRQQKIRSRLEEEFAKERKRYIEGDSRWKIFEKEDLEEEERNVYLERLDRQLRYRLQAKYERFERVFVGRLALKVVRGRKLADGRWEVIGSPSATPSSSPAAPAAPTPAMPFPGPHMPPASEPPPAEPQPSAPASAGTTGEEGRPLVAVEMEGYLVSRDGNLAVKLRTALENIPGLATLTGGEKVAWEPRFTEKVLVKYPAIVEPVPPSAAGKKTGVAAGEMVKEDAKFDSQEEPVTKFTAKFFYEVKQWQPPEPAAKTPAAGKAADKAAAPRAERKANDETAFSPHQKAAAEEKAAPKAQAPESKEE